YHTVRRGWCDLGYNFVIGQNGKIYEGRWARKYRPWETHSSEDSRGRAVSGAHVANFNSGSVGVSLMGNYDNAPIPPVMRRNLARLLAWEADRHDLPPLGRHTYRNPETGLTRRLPFIAGHRDAGSTACPGRRVYRSLPEIRRDVKAVMGAGKRTSSIELPKSPVSVAYGEDLALVGRLATGAGAALSGRTVKLWKRDGSRGWDVMATTQTAADGSFTFVVSPQRRRKVVAVFDGGTQTWGSQSHRVTISVRRLVTLTLQGAVPDAAGVHHLPPGTTSVTFSGTVTPSDGSTGAVVKVSTQQADGSFLQVARREVDIASDGTFDYTFTVPDAATGGVYQAVASAPRNDGLARGSSHRVTFNIPAV
ncbi:MAG: N-acetylmuramoyl-L-alanine amidase, partial [Actinomycetota bacterium]|nr:N-acetylmuramoyl-L-alanine amidase [Actinomycetota bacterium]